MNKTSKINWRYIILFQIVLGILIFYMPSKMSHNNTIYAVGQLHAYDGELYGNNPAIVTQEGSPRMALEYLVTGCMKLFGMEWETVAVLLLYLGLFPLAYAAVNLSVKLFEDKYARILAIALGLLLGTTAEMGMAHFGNMSASLGSGAGLAFSFAAISEVVGKKRRWDLAWVWAVLALVFHIHEGIYGGGILCILWIFQWIEDKKPDWKALRLGILWFAVVLAFSLPALITAKAEMTSELFVYIYAILRTPHHMVPSRWGFKMILMYFLLLVYPASFWIFQMREQQDKKIKVRMVEIALCLFAWLAVVGVEWLFIEVYPVAALASLMIPKFFKYISFLSLIVYMKVIADYFRQGKYDRGILIFLFAMTAPSVSTEADFALVFISFLCLILAQQYFSRNDNDTMKLIFTMVYILVFGARLGTLPMALLIVVPFLMRESGVRKSSGLKAAGIILAELVLITVAGFGRFYTIDGQKIALMTPQRYVMASMSEEAYDLAVEFGLSTDKDEMFISDPDKPLTDWFQLVSRRSAYVSWKNIPSSKGAMQIWYDRYLETDNLFEKDVPTVYELMKDRGISYILVPGEFFDIYDESELFELSSVSEKDAYRIYRAE